MPSARGETKSFASVFPFVDYNEEYSCFQLKNGEYLDMQKIVSGDIFNVSEDDINYMIYSYSKFYKTYGSDIKLVSINLPTDTRAQQEYTKHKMQTTDNEVFKQELQVKLDELEYIEKNSMDRLFYLFYFADTPEKIQEYRTDIQQTLGKVGLAELIDKKEKEKFPDEQEGEAEVNADVRTGYRVLAVTACPTGIAHTYMAAESLNGKAEEMGISIKVETNGSGGAKNVLTKEDIENCEAIIVAADKKVDMARFDGKKVIQTKVADGIHKAEELISRAAKGDAPIYHHAGGSSEDEESAEKESFGRQIYKHLMNGVSHMLPFVIGGGILIALAFLFDDYNINPANFGKNTPLAAVLKTIGETSFNFMLPILAGYISMSIADRPGLAAGFVGGALANSGITIASAFDSNISVVSGGFLGALFAGFLAGYLVLGIKKVLSFLPQSLEGLKPTLLYPLLGIGLVGAILLFVNPFFGTINTGITNVLNSMGGTSRVMLGMVVAGMMAVDMGGPFNKAAYVFGTASLASGNFEVMAAVMAGGMVPPLAIALASVVFRNKFTKKDRDAAVTNFVMGLSFITEGAIPFAAADPLRVIPSAVIGSATAGALSMFFNCTLRAPHGGIFVLPVIGKPFMYLLSVVIGTIVGAILLGILRKTVEEKAK